jgi:ABC-type Zn uptake system ZnuABC Zn-binding protein ZnuA
MIFILFISLFAQAQVVCTHPQVCNLARALGVKKDELKFPLLFKSDPHHYEPTIREVKELSSAKILLVAPIDLQPWIKNILDQRLKKKLPTFVFQTLSQPNNKKAQSHFWMYPESVCFNWMNLRNFLSHEKFNVIPDDCPNPAKPKHSFDKIFVLSHDALAPMLSKYSSQVISLKTSDHNAEILPSTLKEISKLPDSSKVVWILEKNILIPEQIIKTYQRPKQTVLSFDLDGTIDEKPHDRFLELMKKIGF